MKIVTFFFKISIFLFNPLTANDELSRHENLTCYENYGPVY